MTLKPAAKVMPIDRRNPRRVMGRSVLRFIWISSLADHKTVYRPETVCYPENEVNNNLDYILNMDARQLKMARVALSLTVRQTAEMCEVSHDTITRLEAGLELKESTVNKVRSAMETAGVEFIPENGGGAGVRLRKA